VFSPHPFLVYGQLHIVQVNLSIAQKLLKGVELIRFQVKNILDSGVDQNLQAMNAGCVSDVDGGIFDTRAILRRLGDSIHLGVNGAKTVLLGFSIGRLGFVNKAANVDAMRHTCWRAIVSGGKDILVPDNNRAHLRPGAGRALGYLLGDGHEILIPAWPVIHERPPFDFIAILRGDVKVNYVADFRPRTPLRTALVTSNL
jgi:hypothetical protein